MFSTIYKFSKSFFSSIKDCRKHNNTQNSFCISYFILELSKKRFLTNNSELEVNLLKFFYNLTPILQLLYNTFSIYIKYYILFKILEDTEFNNNYKLYLILFVSYIILEKSIYNAYFNTKANKKDKLMKEE